MAKAKQTDGPSKAESIRTFLAENPKTKPKETVEALASKGIKVSVAHVYLIRSETKNKARKVKGAKIRAVAAARPGVRNHADAVTQVRTLAHQLGGMESLKALVDALS
jgi:hypothetical protein